MSGGLYDGEKGAARFPLLAASSGRGAVALHCGIYGVGIDCVRALGMMQSAESLSGRERVVLVGGAVRTDKER